LGGISIIAYSQSTSVYDVATYELGPYGDHAFFRSYIRLSPYSLTWAELDPWVYKGVHMFYHGFNPPCPSLTLF
jgi:hypothetical protein